MTNNTTPEEIRRSVKYETLDDLREDARRIASSPTRTVGNWTEGQILDHLAIALKSSLDGAKFKAPLMLRLLGPLLKKRMLHSPMKPGFRLNSEGEKFFRPDPHIPKQQAYEKLSEIITRCQDSNVRAKHIIFGIMSPEEANQFHLRHAEMHMSHILDDTSET